MMKVPLIYLFIHDSLKEKCRGGLVELNIKDVFQMLGEVHHIKKEFRYPVLKELENFKLISKVSRNKVSLLKSRVDINNTSKIYRSAGLY